MIKEERESSPTEYGWKQDLRDQGIVDWEITPLESDFEVKYNAVDDSDYGFGKDDFTLEYNFKPSDTFTFYDHSTAPLCQVFRSDDKHSHFVMYNEKDQFMVDVDLDDGTIEFSDEYSPDEASKTFWETVGTMKLQPVEDSLAECDIVSKSSEEILWEVRQNLQVPEGESIIEWSKQFAPRTIETVEKELDEIRLELKQQSEIKPLTGWTLEEEEFISEVDEDVIKDVVKELQISHFDKSLEGLIDG